MVDRGDPVSAIWAPAIGAAAPRDLCTDCGISRSSDPKQCGQACQFIKPDYPALEARVHGRSRDPQRTDEIFFGPFRRMVRASLAPPRKGAQWTGITTRLGERLLESGAVDAVLTMAPDPDDKWKPVPVLVTSAEGMAKCRGMRMGYAPLLALLEPARARGFKRIAIIGIPCQVYALRSLEDRLGFERIYVVGTPCSDNTTTANFHTFLELLSDQPDTITYLEFRADYHVELRFNDGRMKEIPFLKLPISKLPPDFFPMTCRTCVDYTNVLADITVGYMGGQGEQWLLVRNPRGEELLDLLGSEVQISEPGSAGRRAGPVKGFLKNVELAAGGLPVRSMPNWLRPIMGWLMPRVGPRGLEFARARVEMKAVETVLHLRRQYPQRLKNMVPAHVWALVEPYGIRSGRGERPEQRAEPRARNNTRVPQLKGTRAFDGACVETQTSQEALLSNDIVEHLKSLHTSAIDALNGYEEALKGADGQGMTPLFGEMIVLHRRHADELASELRNAGEIPDEKGSFMTVIHETIMDVRSMFNGLDESVLPGLIDGEKRNAAKYDDALKADGATASVLGRLSGQREDILQKIASMEAQKSANERAA